MPDGKNFTEYTDKELDEWFNKHIKGWSGRAVSAKDNYAIVIAEMQRRHANVQKTSTQKIVDLTDNLVILTSRLRWLTYVLVALAIVNIILIFIK